MPSDKMMHTIPNPNLLSAGILTYPEVILAEGGEIVQTMLNNNPFPIQLESFDGKQSLRILNPNLSAE